MPVTPLRLVPLLPPCRRWETRRKHVRTAQTLLRGRSLCRPSSPPCCLVCACRAPEVVAKTDVVRSRASVPFAAVEVAPPEPETGSGKFIFPDLSVYGKPCCTVAPSPPAR